MKDKNKARNSADDKVTSKSWDAMINNNKDNKDKNPPSVTSKYLCDETKPTVPSDDDVVREKNWVDHGSRL